jgi:hypothetical protein
MYTCCGLKAVWGSFVYLAQNTLGLLTVAVRVLYFTISELFFIVGVFLYLEDVGSMLLQNLVTIYWNTWGHILEKHDLSVIKWRCQ